MTGGLPDPELEATIDVPRAGALLGLSRSSAYESARRYLETGVGLPCLRLTPHTLRVPTARLLEMLGLGGASSTNGSGAHANGDGAQRE